MATEKLRLKREAFSPPQKAAVNRPVADIWVKTQLPHLDHSFSYLVPESMSNLVDLGSLVSVSFQGRNLEGLVIGRRDGDTSTLKPILKLISPFPILSAELIETVKAASQHWMSHPFDFVQSVISPRAISVEKEFVASQTLSFTRRSERKPAIEYLQLPPHQSRFELIIRRIGKAPKGSRIIVVAPDSLSIQRLSSALEKSGRSHVVLDSSLNKSDLYRNYLQIVVGEVNLAIGTRNAVFAPMKSLTTMIIVDEQSEHFYDRQHPGWNVRDVALLRSKHEGVDLEFLGYAPSAEMAYKIEKREIAYRGSKCKVNVQVFEQQRSELVPSQAIAPIRSALSKGPVLMLVPAKGYAQAIRCQGCRTVSRCECGGALVKLAKTADISCSHCSKHFPHWECAWCKSKRFSLASRGIERFAQEVGLLFPKVEIAQSTADHPRFEIGNTGIVLATPSMAPQSPNGYSAVVILEGNRFLSQPDFRSAERVRGIFFEAVAQMHVGATAILIQDRGAPIVNALLQWNPVTVVHAELEELRALGLPPYTAPITIDAPINEVSKIKDSLSKAISKSLPESTVIFGPAPVTIDIGRLILSCSTEDSSMALQTIHEFTRKRSATKKSPLRIRAFPYSLTLNK